MHSSKLWVESVRGGVVAHISFIKNHVPQCHQLGKLPPARVAATAKSPDTKKASERRSQSQCSRWHAHSLTHTPHIHTHTHKQLHLKHKWLKLQKSEVQMNRNRHIFIYAFASPFSTSISSSPPFSLPSLFTFSASFCSWEENKHTQTKSAFFFHFSVGLLTSLKCAYPTLLWLFLEKHNPLPLNPSLQISGTCWRRCVCPSHAAPSYVSDKGPPGRI